MATTNQYDNNGGFGFPGIKYQKWGLFGFSGDTNKKTKLTRNIVFVVTNTARPIEYNRPTKIQG